ncbi:hypothetical protein BG004_008417 [Podila humilis]|nr:hypothetical protein BG004_008417 [Podila humilis]
MTEVLEPPSICTKLPESVVQKHSSHDHGKDHAQDQNQDIQHSTGNQEKQEEQEHEVACNDDHGSTCHATDGEETLDAMSAEDVAKLECAATRIQSVYRGYQLRTKSMVPHTTDTLATTIKDADAAATTTIITTATTTNVSNTSKDIINAEDPNQQQQQQSLTASPTSTSPIPGESRTRWAWRRAEFLGSRLGKGSNRISTEEALVLLTEHWLEMSDRKHRYGSNLKLYHEQWLAEDTSENFFYWLDHGEGKQLSIESRPRHQLEEQRVTYLQEHERAQYVVEVIEGLMYYRQSGKLVHTLPPSIQAGDDVDISQVLPDNDINDDEATRLEKKRIRNKAKYIYVTDPNGSMYVAQKVKGQFHHSSFLGGGTVCAAGGIVVNNGQLIKINPKSGHYRPGQRHFDRLLENLKNMGISLEGVKVSYGILNCEGGGGGTQDEDVDRQESSDRLVAPLEKKNNNDGTTMTTTAVC